MSGPVEMMTVSASPQKRKNGTIRSHRDADRVIAKVSNWSDLRSELRVLTEAEQGMVFERFAQLFLQTSPIYSSKLKNVWLLAQVPPQIAKKLGLPSRDIGIDIICQTTDDEFWAVQCKYREEVSKPISFKELSTFVALSARICKNISFDLVITTTERITRVLSNLPSLGIVAADTFSSLDFESFRLIQSQLRKRNVKLRALKPREHQSRAISNAISHFVKRKAQRGKLISPCGSGKSLTAFWIAQSLKARLVLLAVPSLALVKQSLATWLRESVAAEMPVSWLCVCSDSSAGQPEIDNFISYTHDLGVPCTTDVSEVSQWLSQSRGKKKVIFCTYQSGHVVASAAKKAKTTFDLGVLDEAHKTTGRRDSLFSQLLFERNIKIKRRLFMTATERRYIGSSDHIISMENQQIYGETFELLSFDDALRSTPPILSDYQVVTISVTDAEVRSWLHENLYLELTKGESPLQLTARQFAQLLALRKAMARYGITHAISFHGSINKAKEFKELQDEVSERFKKYKNLCTVHVSGSMSTAVRDRYIRDFIQSSPALVTNARCLTEGVDIPAVDCVFFADPKTSTIDIVQAAGRAMRISPNKQLGYIIVPLFHRSDLTAEEFFDSSEFKEVVSILRSLASNDSRIIDYFRAIHAGREVRARSIVQFDCSEILPVGIDVDQFEKALQLKLWGRLAKLSWRPFKEARAFVRSLGLKSQRHWARFSSSGMRPADIPGNPARVYKDSGWVSLGDWLGTGTVAPRLIEYRSFEEAREFVHSLGFSSQSDWSKYCKTLDKPNDIPAAPRHVYKNTGWKSMGDWLGTGTIAPQLKNYQSFTTARDFVRKLGLRSHDEWKEYKRFGKKPKDIPGEPAKIYKNKGWISFGDWLGTERVATRLKQYRHFEEAREFARNLGLKNAIQWWEFAKSAQKPSDIRFDPYTYKEFQGMGDWLGTGSIPSSSLEYRSFDDAREFARRLKLQSWKQWLEYCRAGEKPTDIPTNANQVYRQHGWISTGDWLGTGHSKKRVYRSLESARDYVRSLGLRSQKEWAIYLKSGNRPEDIPSNPARVYAQEGWTGLGDWLGTGKIAPRFHNYKYRPFEHARSFVHRLGLKNFDEWEMFCRSDRKPTDIPSKPQRVYKNSGWAGVGDWLGTGNVATQHRKYRSFKSARQFARSLGLFSQHEWFEFCRSTDKPADIPTAVLSVYKEEGWSGWQDWLGYTKRRPQRIYRSFEQAKLFVRSLRLHSANDWRKFCQSGNLPKDIPTNPNEVYNMNGWKSWGDWVGSNTIAAKDKKFRSFREARRFARTLGLRTGIEWRKYAGSKKRPEDIPYNPASSYAERGWKGMKDWLGA